VKALYDYEASAPGELSVKEDELLLVFGQEDAWLLVQSKTEGGKAGFVPENYVEVRYIIYDLTNWNVKRRMLRRLRLKTEIQHQQHQAV
jgi:hypothetical protein